MSKSVPLCATLCIQGVGVIIYDVLGDSLDLMFERFAVECGLLGYIKRKTINNSAKENSSFFFFRKEVFYSNRTISPVLISLADALTRAGVKRFSLPN